MPLCAECEFFSVVRERSNPSVLAVVGVVVVAVKKKKH